jgi:hypothetical protein
MVKTLYWAFLYILISFFAGCQKELKYQSASDLLTNKVWYLEKLATSSTAYRDADGINGGYEIVESAQGIWMHVSAPGRVIESYKVSQLERNHFVAEVFKNNDLHILYFSTRP